MPILGRCHCVMCMNFFYGYLLGYCFDSQCLSECCPSSTTDDKKSTTGERKQLEKESNWRKKATGERKQLEKESNWRKKAARNSQELFTVDVL